MATGQFKVTTANLSEAANKLNSYNRNLKTKILELSAKQKILDGQWDGEANTAFNQAFQKDIKQFDKFTELVDKYVDALKKIREAYQSAEANNKRIANNRTYNK